MTSDSQVHSVLHSPVSVHITSDMTAKAGQELAAVDLVLTHEEGRFVSVKTFSVHTYTEKEIVVSIVQLLDARHALCGIDQHHGDHLLCPFCSCGYNYTGRMIYVLLQADKNPSDTRDSSNLHRTDLFTTLRDVYVPKIMDGRHRCSCVSKLYIESDQGLARKCLCLLSGTTRDKKLLTSWKVK